MVTIKSITDPSSWSTRVTKSAPLLVSLGLIALIAWVVADLVWQFTVPRESTTAGAQQVKQPSVGSGIPETAKTLFGTWDERAMDAGEVIARDTVETKLPLTLVGVFVSDVPSASAAIISSGRGEGEYYSVGDRVPGNAVLDSVDGSGVILRRGARLERLSFADSSGGSGIVVPSIQATSHNLDSSLVQAPGGEADVPSLGQKIEEYRTLADENPRQALSALGLQQVSGEEAKGYRVGDLPDNQWVRQTGLQDGDVLLSVNGRRIGDPDLDRLEIDNFFAEGQVRLEIQRGERRFFVNAKLSP